MTELTITLPPDLIDEIVARVTAQVLDALNTATPRDRLLPIKEAAKQLGLTEAALRKHAQRGNVPTVRIGGRVFIDMEAIQ